MHKKEGLVVDEWEEGLYKTTPCCLYECRSDPQKKKRGSRRTNGRKDALCLLLFMMQTLIRKGGVTGPRWMWVGGVV